MKWKSDNNIWLTVKEGVKLNELLDDAAVELEKDFAAAKLKARITSGERDSDDQLNTVQTYARRYGIEKEFPEILTCGVNDKINLGRETIYTWQRAWSRLLNIGVIVNPPKPAKCLFDYWKDGVNKKGQEIGYSPHWYGKGLDIGGGSDYTPVNEAEVVKKAIARKAPFIRSYLLEPKNNCCHVNCG
jgi:hypothetical protein